MALEIPQNGFIMALEMSKTPDLWRWGHPETTLLWR